MKQTYAMDATTLSDSFLKMSETVIRETKRRCKKYTEYLVSYEEKLATVSVDNHTERNGLYLLIIDIFSLF
jgi:hypothetical protein